MKVAKPFKPQKVQAMQRKLYKQVSELQSEAEQNLNRAKRKLDKGEVTPEAFSDFQMLLETARDQAIEVLRDEHRADLRQNMMTEVYWSAKKVPMVETGCETIDREVKATIGWPWSDAQIAAHGAREQAQKDSDELVERLLG